MSHVFAWPALPALSLPGGENLTVGKRLATTPHEPDMGGAHALPGPGPFPSFPAHIICVSGEGEKQENFEIRPQMKRENPLNLSILLNGGKETNKDFPSNGE